ncbi:ABC-type transport auxiliary lipoprotein family protein [Paraburkholderia sp. DHOC27]|uniref:ABC-type transport auxiliary lipoprotein family protein n=1 Tax=Paraburkholderia sp. DHOC27 TaxID=2303330 RepID=UPI000E3D49B1|nr:ABC-type transport auxiliary lipoprotein family protein [Paraburkholderia sp. DHOC27]RFU47166.1 ABC transporter [Paraburkholderia sp. DHOC27]
MARTLNRWHSISAACALLATCTVLAACAGPQPMADTRYDLGPPPAPAASAHMPPVKVLEVTAPQTLGSDKLVYRLSYADAQQMASYANSHWTMAPAELLTQRLRNTLSQSGMVLTGADGISAPVLKVDLSEFEQVFDSQTQSHAQVSARATLMHHGKLLAQQTFTASAPANTADAAGGARALAVASDDLVAQIATWLGSQAVVAAQ